MKRINRKEFQRILHLSHELAEIESGEERIEHFLKGVMAITHTDILGITALAREGDSYRLGTGYALGLDEAGARLLQEWYIEGGAYKVDPFTKAIIEGREETSRRQDLLTNSDWYSDPHIEGLKGIGVDATMASIRNTRRAKIGLVARRKWGSPAYSEEDRDKLELISQVLHWFFCSLEADGYFAPPVQLPNNRHQQVLEGLLRGLTEKEIAAELMLSPRTVHKYVENLFRYFGVKSRPRLMALWTRYPQGQQRRSSLLKH